MVNRNEALYKHTGIKLRAVREEIRMTLDAVSKVTGISRSYLSDFERGYRLPTSKYMEYLHDHHNINLNYIFGGEFRKFRSESGDTYLNFGGMQEEVDKMLRAMAEIPHALFVMLGSFSEYKLINKQLIEQYRSETAAKKDEKEK